MMKIISLCLGLLVLDQALIGVLVLRLTVNFQCLNNFNQSLSLAIWLQKVLTKLWISPFYCKRLLPRCDFIEGKLFYPKFFLARA